MLLSKKNKIWDKGFLIPIFVLLLSSCNPIVKFLYGVHNPRPESKENIVNFVKKTRLDTNNIIVLRDTSSMMSVYRKHKFLPYLKIFDSKGRLVSQTSEKGCDNAVKIFISQYDPKNAGKNDMSTALHQEKIQESLLFFEHLNGQEVRVDTTATELFVVYYYGNFLGKLGKKTLKNISRDISTSKIKVQLIKANCDMRDSWKMTK
jgi:hypothetical protein